MRNVMLNQIRLQDGKCLIIPGRYEPIPLSPIAPGPSPMGCVYFLYCLLRIEKQWRYFASNCIALYFPTGPERFVLGGLRR